MREERAEAEKATMSDALTHVSIQRYFSVHPADLSEGVRRRFFLSRSTKATEQLSRHLAVAISGRATVIPR